MNSERPPLESLFRVTLKDVDRAIELRQAQVNEKRTDILRRQADLRADESEIEALQAVRVALQTKAGPDAESGAHAPDGEARSPIVRDDGPAGTEGLLPQGPAGPSVREAMLIVARTRPRNSGWTSREMINDLKAAGLLAGRDESNVKKQFPQLVDKGIAQLVEGSAPFRWTLKPPPLEPPQAAFE